MRKSTEDGGRGEEDKGQLLGVHFRLCGGTDLHKPQIYKGTKGKTGTLGFEGGLFSVLACPIAPPRGRTCYEQMVVPARSSDPTGSLCPFCSFPPSQPLPLLPSLPPYVLSHPTLIPSSSSISSSWCSVFHSGVLRALDKMINLWEVR